MFDEVTITAFREQSGPVFTGVVQGHCPQLIRRGRDDRGLLVGLDEVWAIVSDRSFTPQVMRGDEGVSIWLPEFEVYGEGDTFGDAKEEVIAEVRAYVAEYLSNADDYRRAPNRAVHFPHVLKALIAEIRGELEQAIFPGPPDLEAVRARASAAAPA